MCTLRFTVYRACAIVPGMAKSRVMSVAEIQAREKLKEMGQNPDSAQEVLALRARVVELEQQLSVLQVRRSEVGPSNPQMRKSLDLLLEHYNVEPAEECIRAALEKTPDGSYVLSMADRVEIWQGLMRYRNPQLKAVEHSGKIDTQLNITVMDYSTKVVIDQRKVTINRSEDPD